MSKNSLYFKVFYFDMAKSRTIRINEPAEDKAMSMFSPEEQRQLIALSRTYTKNLTELINQSGNGGMNMELYEAVYKKTAVNLNRNILL